MYKHFLTQGVRRLRGRSKELWRSELGKERSRVSSEASGGRGIQDQGPATRWGPGEAGLSWWWLLAEVKQSQGEWEQIQVARKVTSSPSVDKKPLAYGSPSGSSWEALDGTRWLGSCCYWCRLRARGCWDAVSAEQPWPGVLGLSWVTQHQLARLRAQMFPSSSPLAPRTMDSGKRDPQGFFFFTGGASVGRASLSHLQDAAL